MSRKRSLLLVQVLLFLLVTLLGVATGNLSRSAGVLPWGLDLLRRQSLPLAGVTVLLIIGVMVWQHWVEERLALPARPVWDSDRSPFPGLEAFTEQDSAVFFGRDTEITGLLDRLHPVAAAQANRLVTVVGPSGAGKSSLVQAGVVPRLRQRRGGWIVVPSMVPGDHPLRSLARSLAATDPGRVTEDVPVHRFAEELRIVRGRPHAPVLVIVDQAEELITLSGESERVAFLERLASALDADPRLWIILILRSEFLTVFLGTEQARLFRDPVVVGTLGRAALVEVIEQPARRAGLTFDPPTLPQRMATDAGGGDALPLLAYALQELCLAAGPGRVLTAEAYQRIGGVAGVLTRQADKVATELGGADPTGPVLPTLLKFVTIGENEPTRRRVRSHALTEPQSRVAEAFIAARLLTSHEDSGETILEVAHEALFRSWAPLRQAIESSTDQLRWRADLERWANDWENSHRQDAYLLRDERLKAAQQWAASDGGMVDGSVLVAEFLACSNRADHATMERLSEAIARQALGSVDSDPDYSVLLALAALEECAPTTLALQALMAAVVISQVRVVLRGHDDGVLRVAWSPEGRRLATASSDRTTRIWNADNGSQLAVLRGHDDEVWGVAWSPEGQRLATVSRDGTARIWDTSRSGGELVVLRGHDNEVRGVAWSPDGRRLATGSYDRTARIWDICSGSELTVLRGHRRQVQGVAWSPDGRRLATASIDRTTRIWDTETGNELVVLHGHDTEVREVAWSPNGRWLATASFDRTARIWEADSGGEFTVLRGHNGWVRGVAWSPDSQLVATASSDQTTRIWDTRGINELAALYGHHDDVKAVAWSPDGQRLATASSDETARIWDANNGSQLTVLRGYNDEVQGVAWSPDGRRLATASNDRTTRIWDTETGNELVVLHGHDTEVREVAWSPNGRRLATASSDRTARIWDADSGGEFTVLRGHNDWVWAVAWSPDGRRLATASSDRTTRVWNADNSSELAVLRGHNDWVWGVAWSPDNRRLATASRDRTARIWNADNGSQLTVLRGHNDGVRGVAWSPDGRRLVTGSYDRTVRIWDTESGAEIAVIGAHGKGVESVSWSPNGGRIASASQDRTCRIWDATISTDELIAKAHRRAFRTLTAEERSNLMLPVVNSAQRAEVVDY
jgi:WD40 repeat protein